MGREIDHIVYCVPDLNKGVDYITELFGIRPVIGGAHLTKGTKNALLNLGNKCYLEILAIDHENANFEGDRWMGIDFVKEPKITRWSLKSVSLSSDSEVLSAHAPDLSVIDGGSRKTTLGQELTWQMILPASSPEVELLPFMTDWSQSDIHPTDSLEEGCLLKGIELYSPNPSIEKPILLKLGVKVEVQKSEHLQISINVETPNGIKRLI